MGKKAKSVKADRKIEPERAQAELPGSEAVYSSMIEQARDGIYIAQDEAVIFVNKAWTEITGYSKKESESIHFLDVVMPEYRERTAQRYKSRIEGDRLPPLFELEIRCKDGTAKANGQADDK